VPTPAPALDALLAAAVAAVGGTERPGQLAMARAVQRAIEEREHLLVQAGTGTGKSLGYLVPALASGRRVVVATATLALQAQIVERDLPRLVEAVRPLLGRRPSYATLKGRANYLCLHRVREGGPDEQGVLVETPAITPLGAEVRRLRAWADETETGDRDELSPGASDRAWAQVSVTARECLGALQCPYGAECFAESARARAGGADVVVTNHALLAIDAIEGLPVLPDHAAVVVDEGHELVSRVTAVATQELTAAAVERVSRRARPHVGEAAADALDDAAEALRVALAASPPGRLDPAPALLADALSTVRDAASRVLGDFAGERDRGGAEEEAGRRQARVAVEDLHAVADRLCAGGEQDVRWVEERGRSGPVVRVAPLSVSGLLRTRLFGRRTVVVTSATLRLGGDFATVAAQLGLAGPGAPEWTGLDVGSPFDYPRQAILYVARGLPPPGRDGPVPAALDELADLIEAAGGRTLALFSSTRAAVAAAEALRSRLPWPILCQGEDATAALVRRFRAEPATCLFGTLSLWQGVDVPGPSCQLVVVDRIPFPRPDDPLMSARQRAVAAAGGNGFLTVAAAHAALLLAQGAGRLIRSTEDRGVVAVLDPRLATARYASFLRTSLPPMWFTTDPAQVRRSLAALHAAAPAPPTAAR
jgi:ATP-dependent DNA helicase DinG